MIGIPSNRKNLLYRAFRELGRVERTLFLLRFISNIELRHVIRAETTKIEAYNNFLTGSASAGQWSGAAIPLNRKSI
ncbi:Tn3 family transposase [Acidiphilium sp.]|uniref:Tn3 family transposase n=1 Tax=Acidiphilium sp. TaxID=527 RepID=UPI00338EC75A